MGRALRIEYPGAHYHVTSRGNERKDVFKSQKDREQFLSYLESSVNRYEAVIHAYCLMSNHYHLLLETPSGNLSKIMQHINGAYTNYFNMKRKRSGHLFQGRYKAIVIEADEYAQELSRYIHLNPVRANIVGKPEEYRWSSYLDYVGERKRPEWLETSLILDYFGKGEDRFGKYRGFVEELLGSENESPFSGVIASTILGSESFVYELTEKHIDGKQNDRELPAARKLMSKPSLQAIMEAVMDISNSSRVTKNASIYLCHKYSGAGLKEIGEKFGTKESAVSQASRRFAQALESDKGLLNQIEKVRKNLNI
ncbi:MAG: transposase [Desulfuromonadales bacterium]|nr:transposase [Desulfuromonadales bacterium]